MSPQRKIYETRSQKVGDFFIGMGLMIGVNVVLGLLSALLVVGMGLLPLPGSGGSNVFQAVSAFVVPVLYCAPFVVNIGMLIYFGLTRYWIALGMLGAIAFGLVITLCLSAACFVMLGGYN